MNELSTSHPGRPCTIRAVKKQLYTHLNALLTFIDKDKTVTAPGWERKMLDGTKIFMAHNTKTRARTPDDNARRVLFYRYATSLCGSL